MASVSHPSFSKHLILEDFSDSRSLWQQRLDGGHFVVFCRFSALQSLYSLSPRASLFLSPPLRPHCELSLLYVMHTQHVTESLSAHQRAGIISLFYIAGPRCPGFRFQRAALPLSNSLCFSLQMCASPPCLPVSHATVFFASLPTQHGCALQLLSPIRVGNIPYSPLFSPRGGDLFLFKMHILRWVNPERGGDPFCLLNLPRREIHPGEKHENSPPGSCIHTTFAVSTMNKIYE